MVSTPEEMHSPTADQSYFLPPGRKLPTLIPDDVFQETSARCRAVEPRSGSNVIPRRARPGLTGLRPHTSTGRSAKPMAQMSAKCSHGPARAAAEAASAFRCLLPQLTPDTVDLSARGGLVLDYRGTSLTRKRTPPGIYRRPMPRVLGGS